MMNLNVKGLHMELTDAIRGYAESKLASLEKFIPSGAVVRIELGRPSAHHKSGDDTYQAEIEVDAAGQTYFIRITDADLYAAIDRARDEITEMIKSGRGKRASMLRRGRTLAKELMKYDYMGSLRGLPRKVKRLVARNEP